MKKLKYHIESSFKIKRFNFNFNLKELKLIPQYLKKENSKDTVYV